MDRSREVRVHTSLLADVERRFLVWMAQRLPAGITSDHLTLLGAIGTLGSGACYAVAPTYPAAVWGAVGMLVLNWFGDSLDGTVARVRRIERPRYGYYVDHVIDLAGTSLLFAGLACSGLINPLLAVTLLAAYLLVSAEAYLATHATAVFRMSFFGFGPTELRIVLAAGAIKAANGASVEIAGLGSLRLFDVGALVAITGLVVAFTMSAARNARTLYRAEPAPHRTPVTRAA